MRAGIVGSRRRTDEGAVRALVRSLQPGDVVVSGGCRGVDTWAEDEADRLGLATQIYRPEKKAQSYWEACAAFDARNKLIAEDCDVLYAFVAPNRKGGTEGTIRHARRAGVRVELR